MSDEHRSDDRDAAPPPAASAAPTDSADEATKQQGPTSEALPPGQALAKGLGLLFQAAVGAAGSVKESVERGAVNQSISEAGRHLEGAATAALRGLESLVRSVTAQPPRGASEPARAATAGTSPGAGSEPARAAGEPTDDAAAVHAPTQEPGADAGGPEAADPSDEGAQPKA